MCTTIKRKNPQSLKAEGFYFEIYNAYYFLNLFIISFKASL